MTSLSATKTANGIARRTAAIPPSTAATMMSFGGKTVAVA